MSGPDVETVETSRLTLTRTRPEDFADLARMYADPRVMATLGGVRSETETRDRLRLQLEHWNTHGFGPWIARLTATGEFAGCGGLRRIHIMEADEVEVGYGLMAGHWGQGLGTEMARASVETAFDKLGLADLVCFTLGTNRASRRVMEKAGFLYDRDFVYKDLPHVLYRQSREDWRRGR